MNKSKKLIKGAVDCAISTYNIANISLSSLNNDISNNNNNYQNNNIDNNNMNDKIDLLNDKKLMEKNIIDDYDFITNYKYKLKFREEIDKNLCEYLLNIPNDTFLNEIFDITDEKLDPITNKKWTNNNYSKYVKKILKDFQKNNYIIEKNYHQNQNISRRYCSNGGIQGLQRRLKGSLMVNNIYDYDMINASPSILLYIVKTYYSNIPHNYLEEYVNDRENILEKYKLNKIDIISIINSNKKIRTDNLFLKQFNIEILTIQQTIFEDFKNKINNNFKQNKEGKILNKLLCIFENYILEQIVNYCESNHIIIDTLIFDGLHVRNPNLVDEFNKITKKFNIKWTIKDFDKSLEIKNELIIDDGDNYELIKDIFEKNHFMTTNPITYYLKKNDKLIDYNKKNFTDLVAPFQVEVKKDGEVVKKKPFFEMWLKDSNRYCYEEIQFLPYPKIAPPTIYNSFQGFNFEKWDLKVNNDDFSIFQNHLKLLMGNELNEELFNYMENWLGSIIVEPAYLNGVAWFIRSKDGLGKNLFFKEFFKTVLYADCYMETVKTDNIFGKHSDTSNKFIAILNEIKGDTAFNLDNEMKAIITDDTKILEIKNIQAKIVNNYLRLIAFCNPDYAAPIKISLTDRRWICVDNLNDIPSKQYFDNLSNALKNKQLLFNYVNYLKDKYNPNYDWINNRPKTDYYKELQAINISTTYKFIFNRLMKNEVELTYKALEFYKKYVKFMENKGFKPISNTAFGRELSKMNGIEKKKTKKCSIYTIILDEFLTDCVTKNIINQEYADELVSNK